MWGKNVPDIIYAVSRSCLKVAGLMCVLKSFRGASVNHSNVSVLTQNVIKSSKVSQVHLSIIKKVIAEVLLRVNVTDVHIVA